MSGQGAVLTAEMIDRLVERLLTTPHQFFFPIRNDLGEEYYLKVEARPEPEMRRVTGRERIRYNVAFARDFWRSNLHGGFW